MDNCAQCDKVIADPDRAIYDPDQDIWFCSHICHGKFNDKMSGIPIQG